MDDLSKLKEKILENGVDEDGIWQSILNIGYNEWQREDSGVKGYGDMIDFMEKNYGKLSALAVLLGKYNQQVCNGGHCQYYDNGYATGDERGFGNHGCDIGLHDEMIELMEELDIVNLSDLSRKVFDIMSGFWVELDEEPYTYETCSECGGDGYDEDDMECMICGGSGEEEIDNENYDQPCNTWEWEKLDDRYFELNESWEKEFENYLKEKVMK